MKCELAEQVGSNQHCEVITKNQGLQENINSFGPATTKRRCAVGEQLNDGYTPQRLCSCHAMLSSAVCHNYRWTRYVCNAVVILMVGVAANYCTLILNDMRRGV